MNMHAAATSFALQDFLMVEAPQEKVVNAVALALQSQDDDIQFGANYKPPFLLRLCFRLIGLGKAFDNQTEVREAAAEDLIPYRMFRNMGAAGLLTHDSHHEAPSQDQFQDGWDDVRVSAISDNLTLVEYREMVSGMSTLALGLSAHMQGQNILYFRRSGQDTDEARWDFHIWRDSDQTRRVLCHAIHPMGDATQEYWEGIMDGQQSSYEPEYLYDGVKEDRDVLNARKMDAILGTLGVTADGLFAPGSRHSAVLFSRLPGGEDLPLG